jgi:ABC-2 type transport system ATP-binding protein
MGAYLIEVKNISKNYGKHQVLKDVSFCIGEKEIVGFIGPNGAGKSTMMKCMVGLVFPESGSITINGYNIKTEREKALSFTSALIESPGLYPHLSGYDHLKLVAGLKNVGQDRIEEMIEFSGLRHRIKVATGKYSMGMKQRLSLAMALMDRPKFLILDEPSNGLDPQGMMELRQVLKKLVEEENTSILFSSHYLGEVERVADRIIGINHGEIIELPKHIREQISYRVTLKNNPYSDELMKLFGQFGRVNFLDSKQYRLILHNEDALLLLINTLVENKYLIKDIYRESIDIEELYHEFYEGGI